MGGMMNDGAVVVGIDGSACSNGALAWAAREATATSRSLHLIHGFATDGGELGFGQMTDGTSLSTHSAHLLSESVARAHSINPGLTVTSTGSARFAARTLIGISTRASLIVLGAYGHGLISRLSVGPVAQQVAAHAQCAVVLVGDGRLDASDRYHRAVVGVDGSPASLAAATQAVRWASHHSSDVLVVHVWEAQGREDPTLKKGAAWARYERRVQAHIDAVLGTAQASVKIMHKTVSTSAVLALSQESNAADLIVLGARGLGGFEGLRLGSVSRMLLGHTDCPLMIVHGTERP